MTASASQPPATPGGQPPVPTARLRLACGMSGHLHPVHAAEEAARQALEGLARTPADLVFLFISAQHVDSARPIAYTVRQLLSAGTMIGVSGEGVIAGETELERVPGVSVLAASLPAVRISAFTLDDLPVVREGSEAEAKSIAKGTGMGPDHRATFLFADPFSVPMGSLLPALARARTVCRSSQRAGSSGVAVAAGPIIGGLASAAGKPGVNTLFLNEAVYRAGGVGVTLSGPVQVDSLVSQGCKPIGPVFIVTGGKGQMITSLGGRPAIEALSEVLNSLDDGTKEKLRRGLFLGRAINEYKDRFGRDDFLIRNIVGIDRDSNAIAVQDLLRIGQSVQFHVRDQATATEDLALLLDAQQLHDPPAGALLFTCNGRGTRLFDQPHHDAAMISRAFAPPPPGPVVARGGVPIAARGPSLPLAGFFAGGEIGPVGDGVFLHGQTACAALFRQPEGVSGPGIAS